MWEKSVGADKEALRTVDKAKAFREAGPQPRDDLKLTRQSQHRMRPRARYARCQQSGSMSLFREEQEKLGGPGQRLVPLDLAASSTLGGEVVLCTYYYRFAGAKSSR